MRARQRDEQRQHEQLHSHQHGVDAVGHLQPNDVERGREPMKATIQTQSGTYGNWPSRYAAPISQIARGRNR